jgi:CheY-like chemotaxis protein
MSHEIRTPMNAIIGMSELASREYGEPQGLEYIENIKQAGQNLIAIINDILDFSRVESGNLKIDSAPYETASLLNDVLTVVKVRLEDKPVSLTSELSPSLPSMLTGDETRVREILLNLLSNAVKYTNEGFIKFSARCELTRDDRDNRAKITFTVSDSGIGIKEEDISRLFKDFARLDREEDKNIEGTGLGLAIARSLCRAMGGDITVTSEYGAGSIFTATISQSVADGRPMGSLSDKIAARRKPGDARFTAPDFRVLIVDDNATNLKVEEGLLAPYRMRIDICASGEESIELVGRNIYDLILMDHMMPGMNGIEAVSAIRALGGRYETLPVVALTANAVSGMREMFLDNGFDDFLSKPIEIPKLNELVERWVPSERHKRISGRVNEKQSGFIEIEGLDTELGIAMTGGSLANYKSVLELFCRDADARVEFLNLPHAESDVKNFTTQVHALKSASASVGAADLSGKAASLEGACHRGDMEFISEWIDDFRENLSSLVARVRESLVVDETSPCDERYGETGKVSVVGDVIQCVARLNDALRAEDVGTIDALLAELSGLRVDKSTSVALSDISDMVLTAEFSEAVRAADALIRSIDRRRDA